MVDRAQKYRSARGPCQGVVIVMANDAVVSIPSLAAKRTLTRVKMEGRGPIP